MNVLLSIKKLHKYPHLNSILSPYTLHEHDSVENYKYLDGGVYLKSFGERCAKLINLLHSFIKLGKEAINCFVSKNSECWKLSK